MALINIEQPLPEPPPPLKEPPAVAITPCDPWPRPYELDGALRRVAPYHYTYNTNCKERWRGREILEIFQDEFRDRPVEYYRTAIETGAIHINGQVVPSPSTRVKNGDVISHTLHRHEPPVTAAPIGIVHEDDDMIIINKPAGVPVHPTGRYNYNSVVEIMRAERGYQFNPLPCNRLDRLTSGVMFIAKHPRAADRITTQLMGRTIRKEYVARVRGCFPDGDIICDQPILQISPKLGLNRVRANGKEARTVFKRLAFYPAPPPSSPSSPSTPRDGYSIVRCRPLTGRTHQLRVHLQFLGHPITNDPIYSNQRVFGTDLARGATSGADDEDIMTRLARMGKDEVADALAYHDEMVDEYNRKKAEKMSGAVCGVCDTPLYTDPGVHELGIYLHARRYEADDGGWTYETALPGWALPPEGVEGPCEATRESDPLAVAVEGLALADTAPVEQTVTPAAAAAAASA